MPLVEGPVLNLYARGGALDDLGEMQYTELRRENLRPISPRDPTSTGCSANATTPNPSTAPSTTPDSVSGLLLYGVFSDLGDVPGEVLVLWCMGVAGFERAGGGIGVRELIALVVAPALPVASRGR